MHQTSFPPLEVITLGMLDADNFTTDPEGIGSTPERAIDEEVIFVGHSVGGSVLLSYLAVARTRSLSGRSPANSCGQRGVRKAPARQRRELRGLS